MKSTEALLFSATHLGSACISHEETVEPAWGRQQTSLAHKNHYRYILTSNTEVVNIDIRVNGLHLKGKKCHVKSEIYCSRYSVASVVM